MVRPALLVACIAAVCAGCASPSGSLDPRLPPAQLFSATVEPARVTPNPQGAARLSSATGCDVIYIARGTGDSVTLALRPTSRVPDAQRCEERLRQQAGVQSLAPTQQI
jgi:hypothetical protein